MQKDRTEDEKMLAQIFYLFIAFCAEGIDKDEFVWSIAELFECEQLEVIKNAMEEQPVEDHGTGGGD